MSLPSQALSLNDRHGQAAARNRALVLGGGGLVGISWLVGVLEGCAAEGIDLLGDGAPGRIVGTSAGSVVGAFLAKGTSFETMAAMSTDPASSALADKAAANIDFNLLLETFGAWSAVTDNRPETLAPVGAMAERAQPFDASESVATMTELVGTEWPAGFSCVGIDTRSGAHREFAGDVALGAAVAASCSVPGLFPPVPIDGRLYTDGGLRSGTNADLVRGATKVIVLAPMGSADDPFDAVAARVLDDEVALLRSDGAAVTVLLPDAETNAATLVSPLGRMDPNVRVPALQHGRRQGRTLAAALQHW